MIYLWCIQLYIYTLTVYLLYIMYYLLFVCSDKISFKSNLKKKRVPLAYSLRGHGPSWQEITAISRGVCWLHHSQVRKPTGTGNGIRLQNQTSTLWHTFSLRSHLLEVPQDSQMSPSAGDQVFKHKRWQCMEIYIEVAFFLFRISLWQTHYTEPSWHFDTRRHIWKS